MTVTPLVVIVVRHGSGHATKGARSSSLAGSAEDAQSCVREGARRVLGPGVVRQARSNTIDIYSQIGLVMLIGITAKDGILVVELADQLRDAESIPDRASASPAE